MTIQINQEIFKQVIAEAKMVIRQSGENVQRWINAIDRAVKQIEENPFIHFDYEKQHAVVWSQSSNRIYQPNGTCWCEAYCIGQNPCYHRAIARLLRRYFKKLKEEN